MVPGIQRLLSRTEIRTRRTDVFAARYAQLRARRVRTIRRYLAPTFLHRLRVFRDASPSEVWSSTRRADIRAPSYVNFTAPVRDVLSRPVPL